MIEAVKSTIAVAELARAALDQKASSQSFSAKPEKPDEIVNATAPYISPYLAFDSDSNRMILQLRESDTGDIVEQIPSKRQLAAYRRPVENEKVNTADETKVAEKAETEAKDEVVLRADEPSTAPKAETANVSQSSEQAPSSSGEGQDQA